jgi:hypothetical protein
MYDHLVDHQASGLRHPDCASMAATSAVTVHTHEITYEAAFHALMAATSVVEVENVLATAALMNVFARQLNDRALELDPIELRFHAESRLDDMIEDRSGSGSRRAGDIACRF